VATDVQIVLSERWHIPSLAHALRDPDMTEVRRLSGREPIEDIRRGYDRSTYKRTALINGDVAAMWGVIEIEQVPGRGYLWMLTGRPIDSHKRQLLRYAPDELRKLLRRWCVLWGHADVEYAGAIRFLRWIGATVHEPIPLGIDGAMYHPFRIEA
jgi:hypothetical protein